MHAVWGGSVPNCKALSQSLCYSRCIYVAVRWCESFIQLVRMSWLWRCHRLQVPSVVGNLTHRLDMANTQLCILMTVGDTCRINLTHPVPHTRCITGHLPGHHTHTHPFNGPLSGTTWVNRYRKGKTSLDFTEARDSEWQWHQLEHMQVCTSLQTDKHASTPRA